jgi:hypothetical protein
MIVELEKLSHDQEVITACYREGLKLQEAGWMRYPPACWDQPAIAAVIDGRCVACVNYEIQPDEKVVAIRFAFCSPDHPHLLAKCLLIWRGKMVAEGIKVATFTYHAGNEAMHKAGLLLRAELASMSYRASLDGAALTSVAPSDGAVHAQRPPPRLPAGRLARRRSVWGGK